jgi:hypothetical protein
MAAKINRPVDYVFLGSNPDPAGRWTKFTDRTHDLMHDDYHEDAWWSMRCNSHRVVPGTVGFITYADGSDGKIGAAHIMYGTPDDVDVEDEVGPTGKTTQIPYVRGVLWRFPDQYWIDGARIKLDQTGPGVRPSAERRSTAAVND